MSIMHLRKQKGFTIVELLIVIVVIGILAAITIVAYSGFQTRARDSSRSSGVGQIKKALELYKVDNGQYPPACGADDAGCTASNLASYLVPTYISTVAKDPSFPTRDYNYVRGPVVNDSYGILVSYESKAQCKTGNNANLGWWGNPPPFC